MQNLASIMARTAISMHLPARGATMAAMSPCISARRWPHAKSSRAVACWDLRDRAPSRRPADQAGGAMGGDSVHKELRYVRQPSLLVTFSQSSSCAALSNTSVKRSNTYKEEAAREERRGGGRRPVARRRTGESFGGGLQLSEYREN